MNVGINPGWKQFERYTFSPAILRDGFLFISGMTASGPGGGILHPGNISGQAEAILERWREILRAANCDYADVVATREYVTTTDGYEKTAEIRKKFFKPPYPAATGVVVAGLLRPGALIEIEGIAAARK